MSSEAIVVTPVQKRNPWLNPRLLIVAAVIIATVGFLVFNAMGSSMAYFQTVGELRASGKDITGEPLRVGGDVVSGSVEKGLGTELRFTITDGVDTLPVAYDGVVPDIFSEDVEVVAEGRIGPDGVLAAETLLTKCPSRFETADGATD